ncbi:hypothetical protein ACJRO7_020467 [Eucalyptus globulus]|uniref:cellulase n=1 Tax=Eucalyptus globulus TaxID=34317 RepID=A0ABD3KJJ7_EUCGL
MARPSTKNVVLIFSLSFMIMLSEFAIQSEGLSDYRSIDLTGGYYDAGDNVKFGFPMAFAISMLSWSNELLNALDAIQRRTDYLIKVHTQPNVLYGEVGDGDSDHACWQRPEDMTTPGTAYKIDEQHLGADLAGETMAAFAAASIAFVPMDSNYSAQLLTHARQVYDFASLHRGHYQKSIPGAQKFYSSSGYELLAPVKIDTGGVRTQFSRDDKFRRRPNPRCQGISQLVCQIVFVNKLLMEDKFGDFYATAAQYQKRAEQFICNCLQKGDGNFHKTPGGLLWFLPRNNLQYTSTAAFVSAVIIIALYTDYLAPKHASIQCPNSIMLSFDLIMLAQSQAGYILRANPNNISYMIGYGSRCPTHVHHMGASIVSMKNDSAPVSCSQGYGFNRQGPDGQDGYTDARTNYQQAEPATINTAPFVGLLASLA